MTEANCIHCGKPTDGCDGLGAPCCALCFVDRNDGWSNMTQGEKDAVAQAYRALAEEREAKERVDG